MSVIVLNEMTASVGLCDGMPCTQDMLTIIYKYNITQISNSTSLVSDVIWKQRVILISISITCVPHALMSPKSGHNNYYIAVSGSLTFE